MRPVRATLVACVVAAGLVAGCSGGASAPQPFTVSEATIADAGQVRAAFEEYASQWRQLLASEGFRYDTAAGVAQNMTTSETTLADAVPVLTASLTAEIAAYTSRAGSSIDEVAVADIEEAVSAMTSAISAMPGARQGALTCYLAATVDNECANQQDRLTAAIDYLEEALDGVPLVAGAPNPDDSVA